MRYLQNVFLLMLIIVVALTGCARHVLHKPGTPSPDRAMTQVDASGLDFDDDLDTASLLLAIDRSLHYYDGAGRNQLFRVADRFVDAKQLKETLIAFRGILQSNLSSEQKKKRIAEAFLVLRATGENGDGAVLFTGYYEPLLEGSLAETDKYKYPLYRPPPDIVMEKVSRNETKIGRKVGGMIVPYYTRREIDVEGVLRNKGLELIWVSDPVELNSLHIQGSGKIKLEDGRILTVSYAQNNGRPFRSITRNMLDQNRIDKSDSSYRGFKTWLKSKSEKELYEILSYNERYIFFRFVDREPVGSLGEPVTPDRTIATDPAYFTQGALAFIRLRKPVLDDENNVIQRVEFSRFVLNQDKGSAIRGPGRVDLFCGFGDKAQATAGSLKEKGELYFLLIR
jgi:membrane-bound lytic murein transglycosylase A